jgi:hypothetical protein
MAPVKRVAKVRTVAVEPQEEERARQRRQYSAAVTQHLRAITEAHRKQKKASGPSGVDPMRSETPRKKSKGKEVKSRGASLLKLSALAILSHPFGKELASWEKGVAVECGPEWSREAIELAVARGPHPTAI